LESACRDFLKDPVEAAREDEAGQRTMWVFYGDPQWKDPLMVHRWGYTPQSLAALMAEVGLKDVRQEPAEFKLREPRDTRRGGVRHLDRARERHRADAEVGARRRIDLAQQHQHFARHGLDLLHRGRAHVDRLLAQELLVVYEEGELVRVAVEHRGRDTERDHE